MNGIPHRMMAKVQMDRILESAVVLSWKDLTHPSQRGLIHIEYSPGAHLLYLKIWQLMGNGAWSLICEYWMPHGSTDGPRDGMTFRNDYHSSRLAKMLEVIMQHQDNFAPSLKPGAGLIQVTPPTKQESFASEASMRHVYDIFGLSLPNPHSDAA
ncbi:MAG TPA: hypothetical protein VKZ53_20860 [Candidatus Angelobacter sp.]|nr:hypothetical protein [Candidatus Angelobacter sp.]